MSWARPVYRHLVTRTFDVVFRFPAHFARITSQCTSRPRIGRRFFVLVKAQILLTVLRSIYGNLACYGKLEDYCGCVDTSCLASDVIKLQCGGRLAGPMQQVENLLVEL